VHSGRDALDSMITDLVGERVIACGQIIGPRCTLTTCPRYWLPRSRAAICPIWIGWSKRSSGSARQVRRFRGGICGVQLGLAGEPSHVRARLFCMPTKGILRGSPTPARVAAQALLAQRHARLALKHPVSWTSSGMSVCCRAPLEPSSRSRGRIARAGVWGAAE
jgi:hypothetical protein